MSKLLRSELKDIVKECLVEILAEGLAGKSTDVMSFGSQSQKKQPSYKSIKESKSKSYLNNVPKEYGDIPLDKTPKINTNITTDDTLNELLADTAKSTLQEQLSAERRGKHAGPVANDPISKFVDKTSPDQIFGNESASKWAHLAFFDKK